MKKKLIVGVAITIVVFVFLSISVYGVIDISKSLRSKFMIDVVVPILTASITFGGIAYSIKVTSSQQKESKVHEREMLASEFIGKSRSVWLADFRQAYSLLTSAVTEFCIDSMIYNPDIKESKRISEDVFNSLKSKALHINSRAKYIQSFLNPIREEITVEGQSSTVSLLGLDSKLVDELKKLVDTCLEEVNKMADKNPQEFDAKKIYDIEAECNQIFSAIGKNTWECIKKDVKYTPLEEVKEILFLPDGEKFVEYTKKRY